MNGRVISIISEALGGTNVDNCPHACVARPCGPLAKCVPHLENYECQCNPTNAMCNKAEELSSETVSMVQQTKSSKSSSTNPLTTNELISDDNTTPSSYPGIVIASKKDTKLPMEQIKFESDNPLQSTEPSSTGGYAVDTHSLDDYDDNDDDDNYYDDDDNGDYKSMDESNGNNINNKNTVTSLSHDDSNPNSNEFIINQEYATVSYNLNGGWEWSAKRGDKKQPAPHVMGRYMSVDNERLMEEDRQENDKKLKKLSAIKNSKKNKKAITYESDRMPSSSAVDVDIDVEVVAAALGSNAGEYMTESQINDGTSHNFYADEDALTTKELIDDMERIMKNGEHIRADEERHKTKNVKKNRGACFTGADSYFHYNDAETMREIISYKIDLNLRFKTHSMNGLILWTGRHSALEDDDYLSLGIENGYVNNTLISIEFQRTAILFFIFFFIFSHFSFFIFSSYLHMRYNLGSGEVNIMYNTTRVSDGLWHRIRALR